MDDVSPKPATVKQPPSGVGQWSLIGVRFDQREANMAGKDKGGRAAKTPATKSAKEKRKSKKDKKAAKGGLGT